MLKASTDAVCCLAHSTADRTTVPLFNTSEMRDIPEAVVFRCAHSLQLMAGAGLNVSPPVVLSSLAEMAAASAPPPAGSLAKTSVDASAFLASSSRPLTTDGNVPAAGEETPSTPALTSSSTPRMPPAREPAPGVAVAPESTPEAGDTGPTPPACSEVTTAHTLSSQAASPAGASAASHNRRSLLTKHWTAVVAPSAASKTLDDANDALHIVPMFYRHRSGKDREQGGR